MMKIERENTRLEDDFVCVEQDQQATIMTTGGGLFTNNISNCIGMVVNNGHKYGMLHVSPGYGKEKEWIIQCIKDVGGDINNTEIVIVGGNSGHDAGLESVKEALQDSGTSAANIIDETRNKWVPDINRKSVVKGSNKVLVNGIAVWASDGNYVLATMGRSFYQKESTSPIRSPRRSNRGCTIV